MRASSDLARTDPMGERWMSFSAEHLVVPPATGFVWDARVKDRQVPWEGHFRGYAEREGKRAPTEGEVGWYLQGEWRAVWNGTITEFRARLAD